MATMYSTTRPLMLLASFEGTKTVLYDFAVFSVRNAQVGDSSILLGMPLAKDTQPAAGPGPRHHGYQLWFGESRVGPGRLSIGEV